MIPDFYESLEKCLKNRYNIIQTNPRYKNLNNDITRQEMTNNFLKDLISQI